MTVIEHLPMCPVCKVAHIEEADGQQCTEGNWPGGQPCTGIVSWEATADAYAEQLRGAVSLEALTGWLLTDDAQDATGFGPGIRRGVAEAIRARFGGQSGPSRASDRTAQEPTP